MFHSLSLVSEHVSHTPQIDPLPYLFPKIPSTSNKPVDPTSDVSPPADPTSIASPPSAPATNLVNISALEPICSHWGRTLPSHLCEFHFFYALPTLHEPHTFHEAFSDLF